MPQICMNTSQHDISSMQVLFRLLLFLEFNLFITSLVNTFYRRVHQQVRQPSRHLQHDKPIPQIVSEFWKSGLDHDFHEKIHQLFRKEGDMTSTFRGLEIMWKSTVNIASSIQCFKHHPRRRVDKNISKDRHMCLRLHQTVHAQIDSCSPEASHAEISESTNQMHIPPQHAHLQKTIVFEPTSCTNRQCTSLDRFVVRLRWAH